MCCSTVKWQTSHVIVLPPHSRRTLNSCRAPIFERSADRASRKNLEIHLSYHMLALVPSRALTFRASRMHVAFVSCCSSYSLSVSSCKHVVNTPSLCIIYAAVLTPQNTTVTSTGVRPTRDVIWYVPGEYTYKCRSITMSAACRAPCRRCRDVCLSVFL